MVITKYGAVHGSLPALLLQSADTATGIGGSFQLRGMGVSDPNNFESHLFECHLPIVKQRLTMITKMRVQVAPWIVRPARAAATTELATHATILATMQAWHGRPSRGLPLHHGVSHSPWLKS